jgi:nucleotide-binding universal stress UspA family protein
VRFDKILFPVDFSDRCRGASPYVKAFAERFGSRVILLHVLESTIGQPGDLTFGGLGSSFPWEDRTARAKELLDNFLAPEFAGLNVERRLETGDAARTIVKTAHAEDVNLVMLPTHGYGGFRRFILGSVTAKVLHDVECPVWTSVHLDQTPSSEPVVEFRTIVCALDLTDGSSVPLRAAKTFAGEYEASLVLTHVVPGSEALPEKLLDRELRQHLMAEAREQISALCAEVGIQPDQVCVDSGEVFRVVSACAKHHSGDLLILGRGRHSGFGRLRTHSYAIIRESPCPVISI